MLASGLHTESRQFGEDKMIIERNDTGVTPSTREPLTESEGALRLGLKVATLRAWRHQGRGPGFVRLGRAIRYLSADIDEFLSANRCRPTPADAM
jgi:predicted DNA-binding transcriptional regulator AlpA